MLIKTNYNYSEISEKILQKDNIKTEKDANITHYKVGSKIRNTIKELGGILPEEFPTPNKSLKQIEKENKIFNRNK